MRGPRWLGCGAKLAGERERGADRAEWRAGGPSVCGWKRAQAGLVRPGPADWAGLTLGVGFAFYFSLSKSNSNKV